jgi:uncharacterized membrane protein
VRYAQEARPYALWSAALLLATLAVLRARARRSVASWLLVASTLAIALYVQPLSVACIPALLLLARGRDSSSSSTEPGAGLRVAASAALSLLMFVPWLLTIAAHRDIAAQGTAWSAEPFGAAQLLRAWLGVATSVFFRPAGAGGLLDESTALWASVAWVLLGLGAAALSVLSLAWVVRRAPAAHGFVLALAALPFAALALADLVAGGRRSTVDRYVLPSWLALELAVAFCLASPGALRRTRRAVLLTVLALGAATLLRTRSVELWWDTDPTGLTQLRGIESALAATPDAIALSDAPPLPALELVRRLGADFVVRLGAGGPAALGPNERGRAVLVRASPALLAEAQRVLAPEWQLTPDRSGLPLWYAATAR